MTYYYYLLLFDIVIFGWFGRAVGGIIKLLQATFIFCTHKNININDDDSFNDEPALIVKATLPIDDLH